MAGLGVRFIRNESDHELFAIRFLLTAYGAGLDVAKKLTRAGRRQNGRSGEGVKTLHADRVRSPRTAICSNSAVAELTALPPVAILLNQFVASIGERLKALRLIDLMAGRVEAHDRSNVAHAAYKAFGEPAFVSLMAHKRSFATRSRDCLALLYNN